jgi:hypothetical protein
MQTPKIDFKNLKPQLVLTQEERDQLFLDMIHLTQGNGKMVDMFALAFSLGSGYVEQEKKKKVCLLCKPST